VLNRISRWEEVDWKMTDSTLNDLEIAPRHITRINQLAKERIYFVKCVNFVRFSRSSSSSEWLLRSSQPHCPFEMEIIKSIPGGVKLQSELEKTFKRYHHKSLWFRYEGELKLWIDKQ